LGHLDPTVLRIVNEDLFAGEDVGAIAESLSAAMNGYRIDPELATEVAGVIE
jgi:hypothetical protein